ncbi:MULTISPECIES: LacI family DNA-binding transcriptional regulator [unclassified Paenibacillus]|uniref:LacI family DNA-binding transcriptional regulator n=1 Tax=unclassified Paenibacillus TaxID=185978 RepID=UPI0036259F6C
MATTITDIAKYINVSPAMVSRVIHNSGYVSKEKRELIEKTLSELNYVPNKVAQGLKSQKTGMIGHILPRAYPNPFWAGLCQSIDEYADECDYQILRLFTYNDPKRELKQIEEMVARKVDGIIFTSASSKENIQRVVDMGIPTVMVERPLDVMGVDKVLIDYVEASYVATKHLLRLNHKNIGYIGVDTSVNVVESERYNGFQRALMEEKITTDNKFIKFCESYSPQYGFHLMEEMILSDFLPSGIFVASDVLAIGVLQALYKHRIRVPDDISIIGYDNSYADILSPPISSVGLPLKEMGEAAINLILERMKSKTTSVKTLTLHASYVERESVKHNTNQEVESDGT